MMTFKNGWTDGTLTYIISAIQSNKLYNGQGVIGNVLVYQTAKFDGA